MSKSEKLLTAFVNGDVMTGKQITARFGVKNARAAVSALRMKGYPIYRNEKTDKKGNVKGFYRLGTASKAVIAAGYKALASAA